MHIQIDQPLYGDPSKRWVTVTGSRGSKSVMMLENEDAEMLDAAMGIINSARGIEHIVLSSKSEEASHENS